MPLIGKKCSLPGVTSLPKLFELSVLSAPDRRALTDAKDGSQWTYQQLDHTTNQLARCILNTIRTAPNKNPDGDLVVAVCIPPGGSLVLALIAIHKAGASYLPLDVTFPPTRVTHILQDSNPQVLISMGKPDALVGLEPGDIQHLVFDTIKLSDFSSESLIEEELLSPVTLDSLAAVLYTSGSTGVPKGVRIPQRAVLNRLSWQWKNFPYSNDEVCVFKTALTFVDSISEIFGPLLTGHGVVAVPKAMTSSVEGLVDVLCNEGIERLVLVPSLLRSILLHCSSPLVAKRLSKLRLWVCSGEVFPPDLLKSFFQIFPKNKVICNFYGSTEIMGDVTYITFANKSEAEDKLIDSKVPIGGPLQNTSLHLLNADLKPVPVGVVGELFVGGSNNALGYVGGVQKDKFIQTESETLFRTGDYAKIVGKYLVYEGRSDSQVKIRGHRVDLAEVQSAVQSITSVDKCSVLCYKPGEVTQALIAYYTSKDEEAVPEVLKVEVAAKLPPYMQPMLLKLPDLPMLVNGKIDRQALLKQYEGRSKVNNSSVSLNVSSAPHCQKTSALDLLQTVLKVLGPAAPSSISLEQSFFQVGGNSLNAIMTITNLKDLGYQIGISQFLGAKTFKELLPHLKKTTSALNEGEGGGKEEHFPYVSEMLKKDHQDGIIEMVTKSFIGKGDLELLVDVEAWEYRSLLSQMWDGLVEQKLSFVVRREDTKEIIAVSLNTDLYNEPPLEEVTPKIAYILDFLEEQEASVRGRLPEGKGKVIHSFMMATSESVTAAENVMAIQFMENENIRIGKSLGYSAMFTTNTSELTQQVCDDLLNYTVFLDSQVNLWRASDGSKPFGDAPDTQRAVVTAKLI